MPGAQPRCREAAATAASVASSGAASSSSSSVKRYSWIQSANPETPTPSSRTPLEVSSSASSRRATRAICRPSSEGSDRVADRLTVEKSCSRTLIETVRPEIRALRSRSVTFAAWRSSSASSRRLSTWSVS